MNEIIKVDIVKEQTILGKDFKMYGTVSNPLFLAKDVANWIEHNDVSTMLRTVDSDEKLNILTPQTVSGGLQANTEYCFITEDGLYEVLMLSRKPIAKSFKKEVKKILKQIRLTGGSVIQNREEEFVNYYFSSFSEDTKLNMVQDLRKQNQEYKKQIEEQKPLVDFANAALKSCDNILMRQMAKILCDQKISIGEKRLFKLLRGNDVLMKNNEPYQTYIDRGYFYIKEYSYNTPYGEKLSRTTLVTPKGQVWIVGKVKSWTGTKDE